MVILRVGPGLNQFEVGAKQKPMRLNSEHKDHNFKRLYVQIGKDALKIT